MSNNIIWSEQAAIQFVSVKRQIRRNSTQSAQTFESHILTKTSLLEEFPHLGSISRFFPALEVRELLVMNYRIVYSVKDEGIRILALFHTAQIPVFE